MPDKRVATGKRSLAHFDVPCDFQRGYRILDGKGFSIQRLSELYAEAGLVGFKVHARVGGYPIRPSNKALVLLKEHA